MYYIMRKIYYVMHKLLRYAKHLLRYAVIITLCGNYYVMRKLLSYVASQTIMTCLGRVNFSLSLTPHKDPLY